MPRRMTFGKTLARVVLHATLWIGCGIVLVPIVWMVSTSLKGWMQLPQVSVGGETFVDVAALAKEFWPRPVVWSNYPKALTTFPFLTYLGNTTLITGLSMVGVLVSNPLVAYAFARLRAPGKNMLFFAYLSTIMIPGQVTMIPVYIVWAKGFHAIDTFSPLILPFFFASPFYVFLLRQFFTTLPASLTDAAKIDGCNELSVLWRIALPLLKPAIGVIMVFTFLGQWNNFMGPLIYLNSQSKRTLSLGLAFFSAAAGEQMSQLNYQMAVAFLMTIPCVVVFYFAQKTFVRGIVFTGISR